MYGVKIKYYLFNFFFFFILKEFIVRYYFYLDDYGEVGHSLYVTKIPR